jgi:arylformamidase
MKQSPPIWEGLSQEQHEHHYNPQYAVPDFAVYRARREAPNQAALTGLNRVADQAYGPHRLDTVDIYPAEQPGAPVHLYYHGGYWRAQDKSNFAFLASPLTRAGVCTVVVNYPLCPEVTLDGVVASALEAIAWTAREIGRFGGDPSQITISGHSAGAHLCAAALATDWSARGLPSNLIRGAVLISGIYDPAPAVRTSVNAELNLTPELIARHDYEAHPPKVQCPTWVIAGGLEPWQFIDQSFRYAHHLHRHGGDPGVIVSPGYNHFDIIDQYMEPGSDVMRSVMSVIGAGARP